MLNGLLVREGLRLERYRCFSCEMDFALPRCSDLGSVCPYCSSGRIDTVKVRGILNVYGC